MRAAYEWHNPFIMISIYRILSAGSEALNLLKEKSTIFITVSLFHLLIVRGNKSI